MLIVLFKVNVIGKANVESSISETVSTLAIGTVVEVTMNQLVITKFQPV